MMRFCVPVLLSLVMLASCHAAAPKPVIKSPAIAPPVIQRAFVGHLPAPGETLPMGRTNVYLLNADGSPLLVGYLVNDGSLFQNPPNSPGDTGIFWMVERDPTGLRHWRAAGDTAWVLAQAFGDGVPWRVGQ